MTWHIETEYRGEDDVLFRLLEADAAGELTIRGIFMDLTWAKRFKSAIEWQESLGQGMVKLAQDGITIDPRTGQTKPVVKRRAPVKAKPAAKKRGTK